MKLYFHPMSGNSRRVRLVLAHLNVPCEQVLVDLTKGEQRSAAHLARNPNGRVPVLEVGETMLWESRAIMQYLCDVTPGQELLPTEPLAKADVSRWLSWDAMDMAPALTILVLENVVKGFRGEAPNAAEIERGLVLFHRAAKVLDEHLRDRKSGWICGDRLTLADYSLAAGFALAAPAKMPLADYPSIQKWLARVKELPAWRSTSSA